MTIGRRACAPSGGFFYGTTNSATIGGFLSSQKLLHKETTATTKTSMRNYSHNFFSMRDMSSANVFQIGAKVKVVSSVYKAGVDLKGRVGTVQETWEKCDVDPTCCCAEFVDENFAVTVKFDGTCSTGASISGGSADGGANNAVGVDIENENENSCTPIMGLNDFFTHFFSEDELIQVKEEEENHTFLEDYIEDGVDNAQTAVAFDGMSCKAFKLEQLKMGKQATRIAAYESSRSFGRSEKGNDSGSSSSSSSSSST